MPSAALQRQIQAAIDAGSEAERSAMHRRAEERLEEQAAISRLRPLNAGERQDRQVALEFLRRLDAPARGGWFSRSWRRMQLAYPLGLAVTGGGLCRVRRWRMLQSPDAIAKP
jgi:hypothetical protein